MLPMMLHGVVARVRSYLRGLRGPSRLEAEMGEEFRLHLDLRTRDLEAAGLAPAEAARRARVEFGHIETHREQALASRGLGALDPLRVSRLDVKLGLRMLAKYPGLSLVSVIGMMVAIAIAAGGFAAVDALMNASIPLPEGDRIVAVQYSNLEHAQGSAEMRTAHDFAEWRTQLRTIRDFAAFGEESRNLVLAGEGTDLVTVARMTASGFRVAQVAPVLGRPLLDDDERPGAPPVVVIGYDEWQRRFHGDASIIGRHLRLGSELHTVVGVMPEGFRFPVNHQFWAPLQLDLTAYGRIDGPAIRMFGRLAPGASMETAQAELSTIGTRAAAVWPETHGRLRAQVLPYAYPYSNINSTAKVMQFQAIKAAIALLLVVVAVNVAVLVYARTATRLGEISIRTALGASRRRVVTQLFVEAVVLSGIAAALGLGIAALVLGRLNELIQGPSLPFWMRYRLTPSLILYVTVLALVAGVIVGVLPALKVTGRRVQAGLQQITARSSQIQLGRMWTAMIVLQVAVAVAALPYALYVAGAALQRGTGAELYPADEIVRTFVSMEQDAGTVAGIRATEPHRARMLAGMQELLRRLEAEPDIAGVAVMRSFPGYEWSADIDVEGGTQLEIQYNDFGVGLLSLFDQPILAGRSFEAADAAAGSNVVIVNEALAREIAGAPERAIGRRVRLAAAPTADGGEPVPDPWLEVGGEPVPDPWLEVVGVVPAFTVTEGLDPDPDPLMYRPVGLAQLVENADYVQVALRLRGAAGEPVAGRLRAVAASVDPGLQVTDTRNAADMRRESKQALRYLGIGISILTLSVLLLSSAGIYAMVSFTVARRRREIGIRAALGAGARQVLTGIFRRAGLQLGAGVIGGLAVATGFNAATGGMMNRQLPLLLPVVAVIMLLVGLLAALGPARRGLRVQPTEALRGD